MSTVKTTLERTGAESSRAERCRLEPRPANVPAFSCERQSDGEAGATSSSAATPCWAATSPVAVTCGYGHPFGFTLICLSSRSAEKWRPTARVKPKDYVGRAHGRDSRK